MDIQAMIREYTNWLYSGFSAVQIGEFYELTTPYLDRYNDHIQIYVKQNENGSYFLTDDGYIIGNLKSSGVSFSRSTKRREMLARIARNFGVSVNRDSLEISATKTNYPQKKHMLLQTMLTVDDMFIAEPNTVKNFFAEDVGLYLDSNDIFYSRDFSWREKPEVYMYMNIISSAQGTERKGSASRSIVSLKRHGISPFSIGATQKKREPTRVN